MSHSTHASSPSPVRQESGEGGDTRVEDLHAALEVIHAEVDVGQQVNFVDDQRIHAAIGARIFVGFVVAFGDGCDEDGFVRAKFEVGGADEVADIFDDEQVELRQVKLFERAVQHDRVEVTIAARVDLDGGSSASGGGAVSVNRGGDVAIDGCHAQFAFEQRQGLLDERGLARARRCQDVDGKDSRRIDAGAVFCQPNGHWR